jgi:uncharacterized paraquat-inducible protein A
MADQARLQFDRFEPAAGVAAAAGVIACKNCGSILKATYYVVNGNIVCDRCRRLVVTERNRGGSASRFGSALVLGVLATAVCSLIWYAVLKATDAQWGILAVIVGLIVGGAVRKGSRGRGGWRYQTLAIFLTYTAIVTSYVPFIIEEIREQRSHRATEVSAAAAPAADQTALAVADRTAEASDSATAASLKKAGPVGVAVAIVLLLALLYTTPFLMGIQNVLGIVIIGFALYEAWKLNRRTELRVSGPHQVSMSPAQA